MTLKIKACLFDADGVLYRGDTPVDDGPSTIKILRNKGIKVGVITNNSTRSKKELLEKLRKYGYDFTEDEILSSAIAISDYIYEENPNAKIFVIGEEGLKAELSEKGLKVVRENEKNVDYVVIGLDRKCTYEKIQIGMQYILKGAKFYVTNMDRTLPVEDGRIPGSGTIVNAMITCTQKQPEVIIGKPSTYMYKKFLKKLDISPKEAFFVGDRVETDILGAVKAGLTPVLILTGVTTSENVSEELNKNGIPKEKVIIITQMKELVNIIFSSQK